MQENNYNDLIAVLSGNKDIKLSFDYGNLAVLILGFFIAMLAANLITSKF